MGKRWRGVVDCVVCHADKATVEVNHGRLCGFCWCVFMWGRAWAVKSHPDHPHAKLTP